DYLIGLALSFNPVNRQEGRIALEHLDRAAAIAYSASGPSMGEYGDLARLESLFIYLRLGMLEEADRRFRVMLEDGTTGRLYERFGAEAGGGGQVALLLEKVDSLLKDEKELDIAVTLLRGMAAIAPSSREGASRFRRLGRIYDSRNEPAKAVEFLHWAERLSPDWFRPYLDEARIHFNQDDPGKAGEALERARASLPQSLELHLGIAKLYLEDAPEKYRDPGKAETAARTAVSLSQNMNPTALDLLAAVLLKQGRIEEALMSVEAANRLEKSEARAQFHEELLQRLADQAKEAAG
ncbi:MAG: hypothetical protein FWG74_07555, partial [Planctomycetes bacterium]|nr:hypothetical protein [Planctomycetota bacterium]